MSQLSAFLRVIREGESSQDDARAYSELVYGGRFDSFADHPRIHFDRTTHERVADWRAAPPNSTTSAAGAYQITETTWNSFVAAKGPHDFSPASQDECAQWLIERRQGMQAINDGDMARALLILRGEWESFATMPIAKAEAVFTTWGGVLHPGAQPVAAAPAPYIVTPDAAAAPAYKSPPSVQPAPVQPAARPSMPLLAALLPSILSLFAPRAQAALQKITGQPPDVVQPFLTSLFGQVSAVTGEADPVAATAALQKAPPEQVQAVEDHALDYLDKLAPMMDKLAQLDRDRWAATTTERDAAARRGALDRWDMTRWLVGFAGVTSTIIAFAFLGAIVYQATTGSHTIDSALIGVAGPLLAICLGVWREVFGYRFGGTQESAAQDVGRLVIDRASAPKA